MPQGKGTYGSQVGRPRKKKEEDGSLLNDDRQQYLKGGGSSPLGAKAPSKAKQVIRGIERFAGSRLNPYYRPISTALGIASKAQIGEKVIDPSVLSILNKATVNKLVQGVVDTVVPGGSTPIRDLIKARRARKKAESEEEEEEVEEETTTQGAFRGGKIRKLYQEGGQPSIEDQMEGLAISVQPVTIEQEQLPDEEMEEDYVDFVVSSTLDEEDKNYLESALAEDAKLSEIFDQVVESASEFSGSGPVEGLGSEVSDSIPARLSDGEFVFTAKASDEIGADNLQRMMEDAEAGADQRQYVAYGGILGEDEQQQQALPLATEGIAEVRGNIPSVLPLRATEEELQKSMLQASPRQYYRPISG